MEEENKEKPLSDVIRELEEENEREAQEKEKLEEMKQEEVKVEEPKPVVPETPKEEPKKEKKSKKKLIIIISIIAGVLLLVGILLLILLGGKNKEYTVIFDSAGGTTYDNLKVQEGKTIYLTQTPLKEGYKFVCWEVDGSCTSTLEVTKDVIVKAKWEAVEDDSNKEFIITFDYGDGRPNKEIKVRKGNKIPPQPDPEREGYDFTGWEYENYTFYFEYEEVEKDMYLIATWHDQRNDEFVINFNSLGGSNVESQTIKKGKKVTEPKDPTKEGYTFVEWQLNGKKFDFNKEITSNLTLTALWQENIEVTFDSKGGSSVPSQKVKYGETVTRPADPTKENYYLDYWMLNGKKYNFDDKVTQSFTLEAKWGSKNYGMYREQSFGASCLRDNFGSPIAVGDKVTCHIGFELYVEDAVTKFGFDFIVGKGLKLVDADQRGITTQTFDDRHEYTPPTSKSLVDMVYEYEVTDISNPNELFISLKNIKFSTIKGDNYSQNDVTAKVN